MTVVFRWSHVTRPASDKRADIPAPQIMREIDEYKSPITGELITSRTERNADCKKHDAIPWEPGIGKKSGAKDRKPGEYHNPKFAAKRGLPLSEKGRARAKEMRT